MHLKSILIVAISRVAKKIVCSVIDQWSNTLLTTPYKTTEVDLLQWRILQTFPFSRFHTQFDNTTLIIHDGTNSDNHFETATQEIGSKFAICSKIQKYTKENSIEIIYVTPIY